MRINGFRCDECQLEHLIPNTSIASMRQGVPDDWFLVSKGAMFEGFDPFLFCGPVCLFDWIKKQLDGKDK